MRLFHRETRLDLAGAIVGLLALLASLTPSLLPRPGWGQGLISGLAFAVGFGVGMGLWRVVHWASKGRVRKAADVRWWIVVALGFVAAIAMMPLAVRWQNSVREAAGVEPTSGFEWLAGLVFFALGAWLAFGIGRGVRALWRALRRRIALRLPGDHDSRRMRAASAGLAFVGVLLVGAVGVAALTILLNWGYEQRNHAYDPGYPQPTSPLRSGSPDSLVAWEQVGQAGVKVVAGGPSTQQIADVAGVPATDPIRIYVGVDVPGTVEARAQVAVQELERTGAAERSMLLVAGTTGTGWLDAAAIDGFEYLHAGDTALVAMQYGSTPSPVSAILTPDLSQAGTSALIHAVLDWWDTLPAGDRPQLIVYGLSLGSFGANSAFASEADLLARTNGAVLAGTPSFTPLWMDMQNRRDVGSPYSLPVLDSGEHVRWASQWGELAAVGDGWQDTKVAYLQHGNDPIVWVGPSVVWSQPEWLKEGQRSPVLSDDMVWIPVVTAFQGVVDLVLSQAVPEDAGHKYGNLTLDALHEVSGDAGLDEEGLNRIRWVIEQYDTYSPVSN